jgi:mTERF domain-containing protein
MAMVTCAQGIEVPVGSRMFRHAMQVVSFFTEKQIAAKVDYLKNTFKWPDAEVSRAVCRAPMVLRMSNDSLQLRSDFLIFEEWLVS